MRDWYEAQKRQIRDMDAATLANELAFAKEGAAMTTLERSWLDELRKEAATREP